MALYSGHGDGSFGALVLIGKYMGNETSYEAFERSHAGF